MKTSLSIQWGTIAWLLMSCSSGTGKVGDSAAGAPAPDDTASAGVDDTDTDTDTDTDDGGGGGGPDNVYALTTIGVEDRCTTGIAEPLFLPEGAGSTCDWTHPLSLPPWAQFSTPTEIEIPLPAPMSNMTMSFKNGSESGTVYASNGQQQDVLFDEDNYPDCTVDAAINAVIERNDEGGFAGTATLSVSDATGDTCPTLNTPCDVLIYFVAEPQ